MTAPLAELKLRTSPVYRRTGAGAALVVAALGVFGLTNWGLTTALAPSLPEVAHVALIVAANGAVAVLVFLALAYVRRRRGPGAEATIRVYPDRVEYSAPDRETVRCERRALTARRLRYVYVAPAGEPAADFPDRMALELSGPGLPPLGIYKPDVWSRDMWSRADGTVERVPRFELDEPGWTRLIEALAIER